MIQRAWEDVYSSFASSAFASASTVEKNVSSRFVVRAGVLDREPRLVRDAGEEAHRARREPVRVFGDDAAAPLPFEMERRNRVVRARLGNAVDGRELLRADRERLGDREERVRDGAWIAQGLRARANLVFVAPESAWGEVAAGRVLEPDGDAWGAERAGRELDDAVEDVVHAVHGCDLAAEVEQGVGDPERFLGDLRLLALGLVEARVLERDRRMAGEHLEQADVVLVELARRRAWR